MTNLDKCGVSAAVTPVKFFDSYWSALAANGWDAVILHSWSNLPNRIDSDIDYAVRGVTPHSFLCFLAEFSHQHGWILCQVIEHEPNAFFCVCQQKVPPFASLQLDVTWSYRRQGHQLLHSDLIFEGHRRVEGKTFLVPSPGAEFVYLLAKAAAKGKDFTQIKSRLADLLDEDAHGCCSMAKKAFGATPYSDSSVNAWAEWFADAPFFSGVRKRRKIKADELRLYTRRIIHPTGYLLRVSPETGAQALDYISQILHPSFRAVLLQKVSNSSLFQQVTRLQLLRTRLVIDTSVKNRHQENPEETIARAIHELGQRVKCRLGIG